ncbi:MAG: Do family serine endopeptidase [bacterium]|nr:Do family serine endopeptidase [bacterium]
MKFNLKAKLSLAAIALAGFTAGFVFAGGFGLLPSVQAEPDADDLTTLKEIGSGFSTIAAEVSPSIVSVRVSKTVSGHSFGGHPFEFFGGPFEDFFGDNGGGGGEEFVQEGAGSGVIVSTDGYILTNNHVVEGASEITIYTLDEQEYEATIVGTDPRTDLAVIKVEADGLPAAKLGDSDTIAVGEWVLAIGNPFQLSHTVTAGIVSAKGRANVGVADYEDFIQTDAAINPGNSGGALVNLNGEVIGINTAIATTTMSYSGIGFAIPINMAESIMDELIAEGRITRGWLGVYIQPVTDDLKDQFDLPDRSGALVSEVMDDSPAEKAGMKRGDVIVSIGDEKIEDTNHLRITTAEKKVGSKVKVKVIRDGKEKTLTVKIGEMPEDGEQPGIIQGGDKSQTELKLGFNVQNLNDSYRRSLGIEDDIAGIVVTDIKMSSEAFKGGLRKGSVITEANNKEVNNLGDFYDILGGISDGDTVLLLVYSNGHTQYVTFEYNE